MSELCGICPVIYDWINPLMFMLLNPQRKARWLICQLLSLLITYKVLSLWGQGCYSLPEGLVS